MPRYAHSRQRAHPRAGQFDVRPAPSGRTSRATRKLGASHRLIAPPYSLTLPSLQGIKTHFDVSYRCEAALPPARALTRLGWLKETHLFGASSVVEALGNALAGIVERATPAGGQDAFGIELDLTDRMEFGPKQKNVLFLMWSPTNGPQYIPLRPFYEQLDGNPCRDRLMATLYQWLYRASQRVLPTFGFAEAASLYEWRSTCYREAREEGEDVDLEGEVEAANPASLPSYIRDSRKLKLKDSEIDPVLASITSEEIRQAFVKARRLFLSTRTIRLPEMAPTCRKIQLELQQYADGDPIPGLGLSHWRDDAIVSWLDDYCNDQFNSGGVPRPPTVHCFRPGDTDQFMRALKTFSRMIGAIYALSDWVNIASELEAAAGYEQGG